MRIQRSCLIPYSIRKNIMIWSIRMKNAFLTRQPRLHCLSFSIVIAPFCITHISYWANCWMWTNCWPLGATGTRWWWPEWSVVKLVRVGQLVLPTWKKAQRNIGFSLIMETWPRSWSLDPCYLVYLTRSWETWAFIIIQAHINRWRIL